MIKRIRFAAPLNDAAELPFGWGSAVAVSSCGPPEVRPRRSTACTVLRDLAPEGPYAGLVLEWFADEAHLARFDAWLGTPSGQRACDALAGVIAVNHSPVVVADEVVLRGPGWLEQHWSSVTTSYKHMAVALRAADLTPEAFRRLWRSKAGRVGTTPIPPAAQGLAYVQNHARLNPVEPWAYDGLNEVYFETVDDLKVRIDWFAASGGPASESGFAHGWFLAATEEVLYPKPDS